MIRSSHARDVLLLGQLLLFGAIIYGIFRMTRQNTESRFRLREADRKRKPGFGLTPEDQTDALADARVKRPDPPLRLGGISISGQPHEILGVRIGATAEEIQHAYRELMKRYHPDKVGPPGSREWNDAQKIANAIISAKEALIKKR